MTQTAAWWRAYRARRADELRAYNRERRHRPDVRVQRHAQELRRRARLRAIEPFVPTHPLLEAAAALVPMPTPGHLLMFRRELTAQDARSEAVLALVEGRDPRAAALAFEAAERAWEWHTCPLLLEIAA